MQEASVAVYWDFENIHASVAKFELGADWFDRMKRGKLALQDTKVLNIAAIMQYASTLGEVVINKAYANWTNFWPYTDAVNEYSMDLVQLFPLGMNAKNGADIRLSLDIAEDLVLHPHIDIVLLVSGDSDFISIAQRVRRKHKRIVGLGVKEASNRYWQMACNEFKLYRTIAAQYGTPAPHTEEDLDQEYELAVPDTAGANAKTRATADKPTKKPAPRTRKKEPSAEHQLLRQAIQSLEAREGSPWIKRVKIKPMMLRLDPAFDEANNSFTNFTAFLEGATDIVELKETDDDVLVRVKRLTKRRAPRRKPTKTT